jgi:hypothetical protein
LASKKKRLSDKIIKRADELNKFFKEAHNMGLIINVILDNKQLPFPIISVRLLKEI